MIVFLSLDIAVITLEEVAYTFEESQGNQSVCIVVSGSLGKEVTLRNSFKNGSAKGTLHFQKTSIPFVNTSYFL